MNARRARLVLSVAFLLTLFNAAGRAQGRSDWLVPFPAFTLAGNLHYVGSKGLASYLVTTPRGHVLLNPSLEANVPLIRRSVEDLGFKFTDIKIVLISHAHWDHNAGAALVKEQTGASYAVMAEDAAVVETGGRADFHYGSFPGSLYPPAKVDRVLRDGDSVELGGSVLTARLTPGHTKGCTTWTLTVNDAGRSLDAVIIGSPNVNSGYKLVGNSAYPAIAADFDRMFRTLKALRCDLFLGSHGSYFGLADKFSRLQAGGANPFIDPAGYAGYVADKERAYRDELAAQQAGGGAKPGTTPAPAPSVLFIGNSFLFGSGSPLRYYRSDSVKDLNGTGFGGVPALFKLLSRQAGLDFEVSQETVSGQGLDHHIAEKADLIGRSWDRVVMLGYSLLDRNKPGDPALLIRSAKQIAELLHGKNPRVDIRLIATWPRADQVYPATGHWHGKSVERMALDVREAYNRAAAGSPHIRGVIPVGQAWVRAMTTGVADPNPYDGVDFGKVSLWTHDYYHGSTHGYYLEALVIFGDLTGLDPRALGKDERAAHELGISQAQAVALQQVAYDELMAVPGRVPLSSFSRTEVGKR
jgi:metallo-beta-lactamase class B